MGDIARGTQSRSGDGEAEREAKERRVCEARESEGDWTDGKREYKW